MSSVLQNQLLKVEKGLLVCCLKRKGQIGRREGKVRDRRRRGVKRTRGERDQMEQGTSQIGREKRRGGVRWIKRTKGTGGVEGREGGDTGRSLYWLCITWNDL